MSTGHGEKLSRRQEQAIGALLSEPTVEQAAAKAGVGYATLRRWLKRPEFQAAFRAARRQVVEAAIGQLAKISAAAVEALQRNLTCGHKPTEVRAAIAVLDQAIGGAAVAELQTEIDELRAVIREREDRGQLEAG